jgi:phosphoglycolate phosphatase
MSSASPILALDLDGTLIDAKRRQVAVATTIIDTLNLAPLDGDAFWELKRNGHNTRSALEHLGYASDTARDVAERWAAAIEAPDWLRLDAWLPGAKEALQRLQDDGMAVHILTARRHADAVRDQCRILGLASFATAIHVVDPAHAATAKAALLTQAVAFIGDSESDADAARLAGVAFVGVTGGQRSPAFLSGHGITELHPDLPSALAVLPALTRAEAHPCEQAPEATLAPDGARDGPQRDPCRD